MFIFSVSAYACSFGLGFDGCVVRVYECVWVNGSNDGSSLVCGVGSGLKRRSLTLHIDSQSRGILVLLITVSRTGSEIKEKVSILGT